MDDLTITRLCAEAIGHSYAKWRGKWARYDPLHDDAQAMALLKRFPTESANAFWRYEFEIRFGNEWNLNRAICECVATMQSSKGKR